MVQYLNNFQGGSCGGHVNKDFSMTWQVESQALLASINTGNTCIDNKFAFDIRDSTYASVCGYDDKTPCVTNKLQKPLPSDSKSMHWNTLRNYYKISPKVSNVINFSTKMPTTKDSEPYPPCLHKCNPNEQPINLCPGGVTCPSTGCCPSTQ